MLEETCPATGLVPLMRDPATMRKWSAATGDFVDEREVAAAAAAAEAALGNESPRRAPRAPNACGPLRTAPTPTAVGATPRAREVSPQGAPATMGRSLELALEATRAMLDGHRHALSLVATNAAADGDAFERAERLVLALGNCADTIVKISAAKAASVE